MDIDRREKGDISKESLVKQKGWYVPSIHRTLIEKGTSSQR
jgi:hypothetical protein